MNQNSYLCRFISENPDSWRQVLLQKNIRIHEEKPLAIFSYEIDADFSDPVVQEARGIILNLETLEIVCWPFRKFCNFQESCADDIDWNSARVQDKIDGSLIKLWFDRREGKWHFSTNRTIDAENAKAEDYGLSFMDCIRKTPEYAVIMSDLIPNGKLNCDMTYIFELVGPLNKMVVSYDEERLWHLGTRNNITGQEYDIDIGIRKPAEYPLRSLDECIDAAKALNGGGKIKKEGFVVVDMRWHRIKVKSPEYILMHRAAGEKTFPWKQLIDGVRCGAFSFDDMVLNYPERENIIRYYQWQMAEVLAAAKEICRKADALSEEFGGERKPVALAIKDDPYSAIGFRHLTTGRSADEILREMDLKHYVYFINPYAAV